MGCAVFAEEGFGPLGATAAAQTFKLGSLRVTALHDAQYVLHNDGKVFGVDAGAAAVAEVLKANNLPADRVTLSINQLLVRLGGRVVLIDTGMGSTVHGALVSGLAEGGVSPEEVTDVLLTHSTWTTRAVCWVPGASLSFRMPPFICRPPSGTG